MTWLLAVRLLAAVWAVALARRGPVCRWAAFGGSAVASLLGGAWATRVLLSGTPESGLLARHAASGFALGYRLDPLAAWFLLVVELLALPIAVYSLGYLNHGALSRRSAFVGVGYNVLLASVELVLLADGVVGFLFAWELMTLATAALVATEHEASESRLSAYLYLVMSHVGTGCLIAAFLLLASAAGSLRFVDLLSGTVVSGGLRDVVFGLFLAGFGVKAGMIPLHVWLPEAHPAAPSNISALMSGVLIKVGIYGIVRCCAFGLGVPSPAWGAIVLLIGAASAILGVLYALMQHDLKRLLAYHSIENIGIILLGLGAGMLALGWGRGDLAAIGLAAALFHVLNHAVFKGLLFLGAGGVVSAAGTRNIEDLGGLARRMPHTALYFLVGSAAISGLPMLNGFASEWLVFQALLFDFQFAPHAFVRFAFPLAGALLALTTALAAACFVKAFGITFLALPRSEGAEQASESPASMLAPQAFLAALCVAVGLLPGAVLAVLSRVAGSLPGLRPSPAMVHGPFAIAPGPGQFDLLAPAAVALVVLAALGLAALLSRNRYRPRLAPTWACGGALTARNEYTATAFSKPLRMIFAGIYRPTREVSTLAGVSPYFPREVRYKGEIEPTFERYLYRPLTRGVLTLAERMRVIQAGSLHAYLAYMLVLVVALLWWLGGLR
jgi:hydrogenase-4 component B